MPTIYRQRHPEWWARGACHRARIRATRWLCPPYGSRFKYQTAKIVIARSGATKQSRVPSTTLDCFASLAMTGTYVRDLAARFRPSYYKFVASPSKQRAQGMPGARCTRGLVCKKLHIWRTRAYRAAEAVRHPLRNGFTAYFVLSPVSGLFCHRRRQHTCCRLSASIAAPGPHDFAVRPGVSSGVEKRLTPKRPPHPAPHVS